MKNVQMTVAGNILTNHGGLDQGVRAVLVREDDHRRLDRGQHHVPERDEKIGLNVYRRK